VKDLKTLYPEGFFAKRAWLRGRSRDIVRVSIELFNPKDTIDLGCGAGDLTDVFLANDVDAYGLEGTDNCRKELLFPEERLLVGDLRKPIKNIISYDLLTCLEVAEHIEAERVEQFIKNLAGFSDVWLMSINPNKGKYHYTVKPFHWWAQKIESLTDVRYREDIVYEFRRKLNWLERASNIKMILDNLLFFCSDEAYKRIFPRLPAVKKK
jgi:hypothetical protein